MQAGDTSYPYSQNALLMCDSVSNLPVGEQSVAVPSFTKPCCCRLCRFVCQLWESTHSMRVCGVYPWGDLRPFDNYKRYIGNKKAFRRWLLPVLRPPGIKQVSRGRRGLKTDKYRFLLFFFKALLICARVPDLSPEKESVVAPAWCQRL